MKLLWQYFCILHFNINFFTKKKNKFGIFLELSFLALLGTKRVSRNNSKYFFANYLQSYSSVLESNG